MSCWRRRGEYKALCFCFLSPLRGCILFLCLFHLFTFYQLPSLDYFLPLLLPFHLRLLLLLVSCFVFFGLHCCLPHVHDFLLFFLFLHSALVSSNIALSQCLSRPFAIVFSVPPSVMQYTRLFLALFFTLVSFLVYLDPVVQFLFCFVFNHRLPFSVTFPWTPSAPALYFLSFPSFLLSIFTHWYLLSRPWIPSFYWTHTNTDHRLGQLFLSGPQ